AVAVPGGNVLMSAQPVVLHEWVHLALVYNADLHQVRLYVNGVLSAAQVSAAIPASDGVFSMGRARRGGANAEFFHSGIDDVRAFASALTDSQIEKVHDDVPAIDGGSWRFDENTGRDYSWRGDDATLTGGTSFVPGVIGKALQFDGQSGAATTQ